MLAPAKISTRHMFTDNDIKYMQYKNFCSVCIHYCCKFNSVNLTSCGHKPLSADDLVRIKAGRIVKYSNKWRDEKKKFM